MSSVKTNRDVRGHGPATQRQSVPSTAPGSKRWIVMASFVAIKRSAGPLPGVAGHRVVSGAMPGALIGG
jgi:hypothetical protein